MTHARFSASFLQTVFILSIGLIIGPMSERSVQAQTAEFTQNSKNNNSVSLDVPLGPNAAGQPTTVKSAVSSFRQPVFGKGPPLPIEVRNVPLERKRSTQ